MALDKQGAKFTFGQGLAQKDDPNLMPMGKFVSLQNAIFDVFGQLKKRNGFGSLATTLGSISYLTTFQNNMIGIGANIEAYSQSVGTFFNKGAIPRVQVKVIPLSSGLYTQTQIDMAIASNGIACEVGTQNLTDTSNVIGSSTFSFFYSVLDYSTGEILNGPNNIISSGGYEIYNPRVFSIGSNFIVVSDSHSFAAGSASFLNYFSIPIIPPFVTSPIKTISSNAYFNSNNCFDGVIASSTLFMAWFSDNFKNVSGATLSGQIPTQSSVFTLSSSTTTIPATLSLCADTTAFGANTIWLSQTTGTSSVLGNPDVAYRALSLTGARLTPPVFVSCSGSVNIPFINNNTGITSPNVPRNITMTAQNGIVTSFVEQPITSFINLGGTGNFISSLIYKVGITQVSGVVASASSVIRAMGIGSKAFVYGSTSYLLGTFQSQFQSTYFLLNSSGYVQSKVAYGNGQGYLNWAPPSVNVIGSSAFIPYLIQNTISAVNKTTTLITASQGAQLSVFGNLAGNLASFNFNTNSIYTKELGSNLLINGGFLGGYDGNQYSENNFFVYPEPVVANHSGGSASSALVNSGNMSNQVYFYQVIYRWVDNKGNVFRSAPSLPAMVTTNSGSTFNTITVPLLKVTYKNSPFSPVEIDTYRWSQNQQIYYNIGNSDPTGSYSAIYLVGSSLSQDIKQVFDNRGDADIAGNEILYTNGGVVEDVNGPACTAITTFDSRFWLVDAEDPNLLWFSKQVIEGTPVEMSDLFTFFVAPNVGAEGPTGDIKCLAPMDDKLIITKDAALYYINGVGPDNTGAQNQYSQPIFITSGVGCSNPNSIVLIPSGLMFQSNKGIWLLGRDLSTKYIGQDVELITNVAIVLSAITIPNTNQVRFTMNNGIVLLYDYLVGQWGTFNGVSGISSTLYQGLHTYVNSSSSVMQETPNIYQDGNNPTLMSFQTGWVSLSGIQGYKRAYRAYLLGNFYSPHNFSINIAYDYNPSIYQSITVNPTNTLGSGSQVEQWQLNFQNTQCQSFQMTFNEISSQSAGQGLTISGLDFVYGGKKQWPGNLSQANRKT